MQNLTKGYLTANLAIISLYYDQYLPLLTNFSGIATSKISSIFITLNILEMNNLLNKFYYSSSKLKILKLI